MALNSTPGEGPSIVLDEAIVDIDNQLTPLPEPLGAPHKGFRVFMPPTEPILENPWNPSIFLAGSIEMGKAIQWQVRLTQHLQHLDITVCNPRRGAWSPSLIPGENDRMFNQQVEWELKALERVSVICFFFDKNTLSPVTMLELGLWAESGKVVVCCHKDFWKSGNIHHVCNRYNVPFVKDYADLVPLIEKRLDDEQKLKGLEGEALTTKKAKLAAENIELATKLKRAREEQHPSSTRTDITTIHQYQKYIRPARTAFNASTKGLKDPAMKQKLWNELCASE